MTLPIARDLARFGIRICTLAPALFSTPMMERLPEKAKRQILRSAEFPVGVSNCDEQKYLLTPSCSQVRFGHPHEFASAVISIIENSILVSLVSLCVLLLLVSLTLPPQNGTYIRLDGATRLGKL